MSIITALPDRAAHVTLWPRVQPFWRSVQETLRLWRRRMRERDELSRFTESELRDIGISAADAFREIDKYFWRP